MNETSKRRYAKRKTRRSKLAEKLYKRTGFVTGAEVRTALEKFIVHPVKYPAYDLL